MHVAKSVIALNNNGQKKYSAHFQVKIASSIAKGERRNQERQRTCRKLCDRCHRPPVLCVCEALPTEKVTTKTTVLVLQHPNEFRKKTFSTVPLMSLVLENIFVKVGYSFELKNLPLVSEYLDRGQKPLLLFPGENALSLDEPCQLNSEANAKSDTDAKTRTNIRNKANLLIVLDGTWAEAKRMAFQSPSLLETCQQVQFSAEKSCIYDAVRKEPEGYCLSTLEACAQALNLLEGAHDASSYLVATLQSMVDTKLLLERQRVDVPRHEGKKLYERNRRRREVQKALFEAPNARLIQDDTGSP